MSFDHAAAAGLVTREVRSSFRDGAATKIAIARRVYLTGQADLWDALTNSDRIPRWFLPVSGDLRVGGRYQLEGNAGGVVERCKEPESFAVTWEFGGMLSWLEVTLIPDGERTTLELAHEAHVTPDLWGQFGPGAVGVGWDLALMGLGRHIDSGAPVDPDEAAAFAASPDGAAFIRAAAAGWAGGAVADGDEPGAAQQAAAHTVAFYTTPPGAAAGSQVHGVFEALGDPIRRLILELLAAGEQPAGSLAAALQSRMPISQPAVSQHLKVLREANLVTARVAGTRRIYALDHAGLDAARAWLARLADPLAPFTQPLDALATELARGRRARRAAHPGQPRAPRVSRPADQGSQPA